jgi:predicted RNA-binding protein with PIN domain
MSLHLIIDGYNLIRRSPSLSILDREHLEKGREELIRRLALYKQARALQIIVIFDGWNQGSLSGSQTTQRGIRVVFSRRGQKADEIIVRKAREMGEKAMVVTSDRQIQLDVQRYQATVIPSEDFELKMEMAAYGGQERIDSEDFRDQTETKGTRKKGPSRRLPKDVRKAKRRMGKL